MNYSNEKIRRQDRLLDEETARLLLKNGEYGVLSMQTPEGGGYGIPVNFVWDGTCFIYLHSAPEGEKLRCIASCNRVSFCVTGKTNVVSNKFTTGYESIILKGEAKTGLREEERRAALKLFIAKYSPEDTETGLKYIEKSFHRTEIIRLDVHEWTGKCKRVK